MIPIHKIDAAEMLKKTAVFVLICLCLAAGNAGAPVSVADLKCENLTDPVAIDTATPHLSWKLSDGRQGAVQKYYQVQASSDSISLTRGEAALWDSRKVRSHSSVMVPYEGLPLGSNSLCYWRVRVWSDKGGASEWSRVARFGVGLIDRNDIKGGFIGHPYSGNVSPILRRSFEVENLAGVWLLHVNALGYYEVYLNGEKVGDDVLAPALSQMNKRSLIVTYDVGRYLKEGENEIAVWLGQGWRRKNTFGRWEKDDPYDGPLVRAQLDRLRDGGWETVCKTDLSWQTCLSGYSGTGSWNALDFGGEKIDAALNPADMRKETLDRLSWRSPVAVDKPELDASPQMCEPNVICETLEAKIIREIGENEWFVDMGKVIAGWMELRLSGLDPGSVIVINYNDEIDKEGNPMDQKQSDTYIARGGAEETFINKFNHHAFRYAVISGLPDKPRPKDVKAHLIRTRYAAASSFECSDPDLNAIHDMIFHTMQCLTLGGYMVDCPHLERAGYGGDGNSSTETLQTMYDVSPLFYNWIQSWGDAMRAGGSLPHVAPNAGAGGGGPYWCGFMVMAPWQTYMNYGDRRPIERFYPAMKEWLGYVDKYTVDGLLTRWPDTEYRDWYLGDWLAPHGVDSGNEASISLVNNCFISDCLAKMEKMAVMLGETDDANRFREKRNALNTLLHRKFFNAEDNTYATGSQLDMTYPMLVGVTPEAVYDKVKERLFALTESRMGGHIGGGLVGVPIITKWAIENHAADYIYTMLGKRDYPGYLYMIDNGATTTWEYWSGERSRVHNCYNGIGMWFYQAVGGLRPDENGTGYNRIIIDPQIPSGVTWSKVSKETPYGTVKLDWELDGNTLNMDVYIPCGVTATVPVPPDAAGCRIQGKKATLKDSMILGSGNYRISFDLN